MSQAEDAWNGFVQRYTYTMNRLNDWHNSRGLKPVIRGLIDRYFNGDASAFAKWYHDYYQAEYHNSEIPSNRIMSVNEAHTLFDWDYRHTKQALDKHPNARLRKELHHDRECLASLKRFKPTDWITTRDGFINHLSPLGVTTMKLNLAHPHQELLGKYVISHMPQIINRYRKHQPLVWL